MTTRNLAGALLAATLATLAMSPAASAHTHLHGTSIANNARLTTAPASFTVAFEGKTGLAKVGLSDAAGKAVPLKYTRPSAPAASFTIPLPKLTAGAYTLTWRTIGADGHAMPGEVRFTVTGG